MTTDWEESIGLFEFLRDYPLMAVRPEAGSALILQGTFSFTATSSEGVVVTDSYALRIQVPRIFPRDLPNVVETVGRIPRRAEFHVNSADDTLCLGSPIRFLTVISGDPSLTGFAADCLVPYLHAVSRRLKSNEPLAFGELAHGQEGALADYVGLFGLRHPDQAMQALRLLGMRRRLANKQPCPCCCGRRLGQCGFNWRVAPLRRLAGRPLLVSDGSAWATAAKPVTENHTAQESSFRQNEVSELRQSQRLGGVSTAQCKLLFRWSLTAASISVVPPSVHPGKVDRALAPYAPQNFARRILGWN